MAAFFLIMSIVPFMMLLISLTRFILPDELEGLVKGVTQFMPQSMAIFCLRVINELFVVDSSSIISLTVLLALWTSSKAIMGLEQGMHVIYGAPLRGNYILRRIRCTLYTLVFLIAIIIACVFLVFGRSISLLLQEHVSFLARMTRLVFGFRVCISVVVFITAFTLGYKNLTGVPCTFLETLPGVICSTIGWVGFSYIFSIYIRNFSDYTYLYGSMGILMLLFMWFYICLLILMVGAELNVMLWELAHHRFEF